MLKILAGALLIAGLAAGPAAAVTPTPYSGTQIVETGKPFKPYVEALRTSIKQNGMVLIGLACATCGAKSIGVDIPGNRVFLFFNPHFAVRMLKASEAAGIEAPIRIYVTETAAGHAKTTYRMPSHVFGAYDAPGLDDLGRDLDAVVAKILADAAAAVK